MQVAESAESATGTLWTAVLLYCDCDTQIAPATAEIVQAATLFSRKLHFFLNFVVIDRQWPNSHFSFVFLVLTCWSNDVRTPDQSTRREGQG